MDCSLPGSSIHGIFQARVLEGVAIAFSEYYAGIYEEYRNDQAMVCMLRKFRYRLGKMKHVRLKKFAGELQ